MYKPQLFVENFSDVCLSVELYTGRRDLQNNKILKQ